MLPGYTKFNSIIATRAYLNTGVIADANTGAEIKFRLLEGPYEEGPHLLSATGWYFPIPRNYPDTKMLAYRCGGAVNINYDILTNVDYTFQAWINNNNILINGVQVATRTVGSVTPTTPLYMLAYGTEEGKDNPRWSNFVGIFYYCKIYSGNTLIRSYVPAADLENHFGYYDEVNDTFSSPNNGTLELHEDSLIINKMTKEGYDEITRSPTEFYQYDDGLDYQTTNNLTTTISASSTHQQYPSAKAVYDFVHASGGYDARIVNNVKY